MRFTRRELLSAAAAAPLAFIAGAWRLAAQENVQSVVVRRIAEAIREYEAQGFHRTATAVDDASGKWLVNEVGKAGLRATLESFAVNRVDPVTSAVTIGNRRIEGFPLFDAEFTAARGIQGRLGALGSQAEIGLGETAVNAAPNGVLGEARRIHRHQAIIAITNGRRPGLCPSNADSFLSPFGPPVLQVSSEEAGWLSEHARQGSEAHVVAHVKRAAVTATNVTAHIDGAEPKLKPVVIMTPRSGVVLVRQRTGRRDRLLAGDHPRPRASTATTVGDLRGFEWSRT